MGGREVEAPLGGRGRERPETDGVVERAGEEGVRGWAESQGSNRGGVAFEVAEELVVVGGEVADGVVAFCRSIDDRLGMVGKACEVGTILFAEEGLDRFAFFGGVELEGFVAASSEEEFARVVEVEGRHSGVGLAEFELLERVSMKQIADCGELFMPDLCGP